MNLRQKLFQVFFCSLDNLGFGTAYFHSSFIYLNIIWERLPGSLEWNLVLPFSLLLEEK